MLNDTPFVLHGDDPVLDQLVARLDRDIGHRDSAQRVALRERAVAAGTWYFCSPEERVVRMYAWTGTTMTAAMIATCRERIDDHSKNTGLIAHYTAVLALIGDDLIVNA